jgi:hypothetical protein
MAVFQSDQHLYDVLHLVFQEVTANPKHTETFTRSNLVIRLRTTHPDAEILLDGRQPPLEVFYGVRPGKANLEISLSGDLLHSLWSGKESTAAAFFSGKIKTKGNTMKAMQLIELFREVERVYPPIARAQGMPE